MAIFPLKCSYSVNLLLHNKFWHCGKTHHDHLWFLNSALTKRRHDIHMILREMVRTLLFEIGILTPNMSIKIYTCNKIAPNEENTHIQ